jgi:hypothetical protein
MSGFQCRGGRRWGAIRFSAWRRPVQQRAAVGGHILDAISMIFWERNALRLETALFKAMNPSWKWIRAIEAQRPSMPPRTPGGTNLTPRVSILRSKRSSSALNSFTRATLAGSCG